MLLAPIRMKPAAHEKDTCTHTPVNRENQNPNSGMCADRLVGGAGQRRCRSVRQRLQRRARQRCTKEKETDRRMSEDTARQGSG